MLAHYVSSIQVSLPRGAAVACAGRSDGSETLRVAHIRDANARRNRVVNRDPALSGTGRDAVAAVDRVHASFVNGAGVSQGGAVGAGDRRANVLAHVRVAADIDVRRAVAVATVELHL